MREFLLLCLLSFCGWGGGSSVLVRLLSRFCCSVSWPSASACFSFLFASAFVCSASLLFCFSASSFSSS